jgi:hypothetical protein
MVPAIVYYELKRELSAQERRLESEGLMLSSMPRRGDTFPFPTMRFVWRPSCGPSPGKRAVRQPGPTLSTLMF